MFHFDALAVPFGGLEPFTRLRVGVLWTDPLGGKPDVPMSAHSLSSTLHSGGGQDTWWSVDLFRPPPAGALFEIQRHGERARLALGEIVLFDDVDGDETFSVSGPRALIGAPDRFVAGSVVVLRYVEEPFLTANVDFPLGFATSRAYQTVELKCAGRVRPTTGATFIEPFQLPRIPLYVQPSAALPELRTCMRTHSR